MRRARRKRTGCSHKTPTNVPTLPANAASTTIAAVCLAHLGGELAISLLTRNYRQAEYRAERLNRMFSRAIALMVDRQKIAEILRQYLRAYIAEDEAQWLRTPPGQAAYCYWWEKGEDPVKADIETTAGWLAEARIDARGRYFIGYEEGADDIIATHGLTAADRPAIALGLVQAKIEMLEARLRRLRGDGPSILGDAPLHVPKPLGTEADPDPPTGPAALSEVLPGALTFL